MDDDARLPPVGTLIRFTASSEEHIGRVGFVGPTDFAAGVWVGVVLDTPAGKNDGSVKGKKYFACPPDHGIFIRPQMITKVETDSCTWRDSCDAEVEKVRRRGSKSSELCSLAGVSDFAESTIASETLDLGTTTEVEALRCELRRVEAALKEHIDRSEVLATQTQAQLEEANRLSEAFAVEVRRLTSELSDFQAAKVSRRRRRRDRLQASGSEDDHQTLTPEQVGGGRRQSYLEVTYDLLAEALGTLTCGRTRAVTSIEPFDPPPGCP